MLLDEDKKVACLVVNEGLFHKTAPEGKVLFEGFHLWS